MWHDRPVDHPDIGDRAGAGGAEPGRWDVAALRAGASICIALAVPFRILAAVVGSGGGDGSGGLDALFFVVFLVFFVIGSGCAAWIQRTGTPMSHALVTASATYVAVEAVFVVVRTVRGTQIPWASIVVTLTLVLMCGLVGGFLGNRLQAGGVLPTRR